MRRSLREGAPGIDLSTPTRYDELYMRGWWAVTRVVGYALPLLVWPLFFRRDHLADFGLRVRGFSAHAWIYALCVVVMVPVLLLVAGSPTSPTTTRCTSRRGDRGWTSCCGRSIYLAQFFGLELFFRGFWLRAMRSFGSGAIWSMVVPYCMIHYGKPYLEASAAIIAGVVLGSLAMRTRSIYAGFLVHATVAVTDGHPGARAPQRLAAAADAAAADAPRVHRTGRAVIWIAWALALAVLAVKVRRSLPEIRAAIRRRGPDPSP